MKHLIEEVLTQTGMREALGFTTVLSIKTSWDLPQQP